MKEQLVLQRVPPGDNWADVMDEEKKFTSLTSALAYVAKKSASKEFHVSAKEGKVWIITNAPEVSPEIDDFYGD